MASSKDESAETYDLNPNGVQPSWPERLPASPSNDIIAWPEQRPYSRFQFEP